MSLSHKFKVGDRVTVESLVVKEGLLVGLKASEWRCGACEIFGPESNHTTNLNTQDLRAGRCA